MFIKLSAIIILLELAAGQTNNHDWELAVLVNNEIKLLDTSGSSIKVPKHTFNKLKAITYDYSRKQFYVSDSNDTMDTIYALQLSKETDIKPIIRELPHDIQGIAFDPFEDRLYWTDYNNKTINSISLRSGSEEAEVFLQLKKEIPDGIAIDSCNRMLYWTNSYRKNASIESVSLKDKSRTVLVSTDLERPGGIAIDYYMQQIYWADNVLGTGFKIESISFDGTDRKIFHSGHDQNIIGIAISGDYVYWTDIKNENLVRKHKSGKFEPENWGTSSEYKSGPSGITSKALGFMNKLDCNKRITYTIRPSTVTSIIKDNQKEEDAHLECFNGGLMNEDGSCECQPGFTGVRCQIDTCYNYCVHGKCLPIQNTPTCQCFDGYSGPRCEREICEGFCLNSGMCSSLNGTAVCRCPPGVNGTRCETVLVEVISTQSIRMKSESILEETKNRFEDPFFCLLLVAVALEMVIISVLGVIIGKKQRRPRIKKRIVVNKNITPLAYTPQQPPTAQCEITIENCCNMNVCETPCFEPPSIRAFPTSEKDEKKMLLKNMDDDIY